jgi:uncharacterized protein (TIGR03089 family)
VVSPSSLPSRSALPGDVPGLLRRLLTDDPGRPRLTWYGPDGERVELSAKVLDNWVAKTANLLVDELDAGPGSRVALAMPAHWRTVTWLLAIWSTGACAVVVPAGSVPPADVDVLVSPDAGLLAAAGSVAGGAATVAVALPALAAGYGPGLPEGALDAGAGIRSHGDVFVPFVLPTPGDPALESTHGTVRHGDLIASAARAADGEGWPVGVRLLTGAAPAAAIDQLLAPLVRAGSVVLHHDLASLDATALAALRSQEAVTAP